MDDLAIPPPPPLPHAAAGAGSGSSGVGGGHGSGRGDSRMSSPSAPGSPASGGLTPLTPAGAGGSVSPQPTAVVRGSSNGPRWTEHAYTTEWLPAGNIFLSIVTQMRAALTREHDLFQGISASSQLSANQHRFLVRTLLVSQVAVFEDFLQSLAAKFVDIYFADRPIDFLTSTDSNPKYASTWLRAAYELADVKLKSPGDAGKVDASGAVPKVLQYAFSTKDAEQNIRQRFMELVKADTGGIDATLAGFCGFLDAVKPKFSNTIMQEFHVCVRLPGVTQGDHSSATGFTDRRGIDALLQLIYGVRCLLVHGSPDKTASASGALGRARQSAKDFDDPISEFVKRYDHLVDRNSTVGRELVLLTRHLYVAVGTRLAVKIAEALGPASYMPFCVLGSKLSAGRRRDHLEEEFVKAELAHRWYGTDVKITVATEHAADMVLSRFKRDFVLMRATRLQDNRPNPYVALRVKHPEARFYLSAGILPFRPTSEGLEILVAMQERDGEGIVYTLIGGKRHDADRSCAHTAARYWWEESGKHRDRLVQQHHLEQLLDEHCAPTDAPDEAKYDDGSCFRLPRATPLAMLLTGEYVLFAVPAADFMPAENCAVEARGRRDPTSNRMTLGLHWVRAKHLLDHLHTGQLAFKPSRFIETMRSELHEYETSEGIQFGLLANVLLPAAEQC